MIVWTWSLLVAVHFLLTVGNCQWTVNVLLYEFENKHIAEIKNGKFCCCNSKDEANDCVDSTLPDNCADKCDTWFDVSITPCAGVGGLRCSVSTESGRIKNSPPVGDYGYVFRLKSYARPENLTVDMRKNGQSGGGNSEIDRFTVTLSLSAANQITSYTGDNKIAVILLSYQIHCMNLADCSRNHRHSRLNTGSSANTISISLATEDAKPTLSETIPTARRLMSSVNTNLECSSYPQLLESERSKRRTWMGFAIFFLLLVLAMTAVTILVSILHFKVHVYFRNILKSGSEVKSKEGGCKNMYAQNFRDDAFSSQKGSSGAQGLYSELDNTLYRAGSASAYAKKGPMDKVDEGVYELATAIETDADDLYETPVPLDGEQMK